MEIKKTIKETKKISDVLQPTGDLVFIKNPNDDELENYKSNSGIILGKSIAKDEILFEIVGIGPLVTNCKIGDKVILDVNATTNAPIRVCDKIQFIIVRSFQVFGVLIK